MYHRKDWDGHVSAAIARFALRHEQITLMPYDYGDLILRFPKYEAGDVMYVLDVSHPVLTERPCVWIDHHETAINRYPATIPGKREIGTAACVLTWQYFFPKTPVPYWIEMIGRHDVWDVDQEVFEFNAGMYGCYEMRPDNLAPLFLSDETNLIQTAGKVLVKAEINEAMAALDAQRLIQGIRFSARNGHMKSLSSMFLETADVYIAWHYTQDDTIRMSLRNSRINEGFKNETTGVDVAAIAQKLNPSTGGHKGAAGCFLRNTVLNNSLLLDYIAEVI
jgi:oligoribonuclease NrnB/cAMP/cGMP phosphodiesterase (DHH superfamily)